MHVLKVQLEVQIFTLQNDLHTICRQYISRSVCLPAQSDLRAIYPVHYSLKQGNIDLLLNSVAIISLRMSRLFSSQGHCLHLSKDPFHIMHHIHMIIGYCWKSGGNKVLILLLFIIPHVTFLYKLSIDPSVNNLSYCL